MSKEIETLATEALTVPDRAKAIVITSNTSYLEACELLKTIKALRNDIASTFGPIREKAHAAWKETIRQQEKVEAPLEEGEAALKRSISGWMVEQERLRREEELRQQLLAQQEEERLQLESAVILEQMGEDDSANALLEERMVAAPVVVPRTVPKVQGIAMRETWDFDIIDAMKIPRQYLVPDMVKIRGVVRALKAAANIPGIRVKQVSGISAGRK